MTNEDLFHTATKMMKLVKIIAGRETISTTMKHALVLITVLAPVHHAYRWRSRMPWPR